METTLRTVRLYGKLGQRFGRVHRFALDTNSVSEAIQALSSQCRGFQEWLVGAKDRGIAFVVFAGKRSVTEEELPNPVGATDIRIAPVLIGSKSGGIGSIILGAVLVVAGAVLSFTPAAALSPYLYSAGISMIAGGVVQMLSPQAKGLHSKDSSANQPSYAFNGPVNTEAQGNPVPLFYGGPLKIGSAVISAGITTQDMAAAYQAPAQVSGWMGHGGDLFASRIAQP
ncbi:Phage-related protein, tail component [Dyella jiangningensis]|uniref:tail assembly protein n=1 Tax=Dyella sp. AtDHG13 TaxID=1938897 RepID=UPI000882669B|nr:DUF308 domain-containing protein [Dyella sp. AtDHG13]PXV60651.1 putative phage tail protein [Dyella sp. AtDHG13]SDJ53811.1 Phage-related protein, tail component [Dyella jiangningensis]